MNKPNALTTFRKLFSPWVILGGIGVAILLLGVFLATIFSLRAKPDAKPLGTAVLYVIPAPTDTKPVPSPTATLTPVPVDQPAPPGGVGVSVGALVQISGTGLDGLRIRTDPGLSGQIKFLGIEAEVFQVKDGPRQADGYTWWFLEAPYDTTLNGWAVGDFLQVIQNP
jgi:hypothetical protein